MVKNRSLIVKSVLVVSMLLASVSFIMYNDNNKDNINPCTKYVEYGLDNVQNFNGYSIEEVMEAYENHPNFDGYELKIYEVCA